MNAGGESPTSPAVRAREAGVLVTERLTMRPARDPDFAAENAALVALAQALTGPDESFLQFLAELALVLCHAESSGVSVLRAPDEGGPCFDWVAAAGLCRPSRHATFPFEDSASGITVTLNAPQLFSYPRKHFSYLSTSRPDIVEGLVVVIPAGEGAHGTLWVASHSEDKQFDREDCRVLDSLARFASAALSLRQSRRQAEVEAEQTHRAGRALEQSDARREEFISMLGHELRNPMSPIENAIAIAKRSVAADEVAVRALTIAQRQMRQLRTLVDDLLDAARVRQGKLALKRSHTSLNEVVFDALTGVQHHIDARRHTLVLKGVETKTFVFADHVRLSQLIGNLVSNAAKYTPTGGRIEVAVHSRASELADDVEPTAENRVVTITVRDNGVGIDADVLPKVFELFAQGPSASNARAEGGLGIGLALVKRIVDLHDGSIEIVSEGANKGTLVTLRLPILSRKPDRVAQVETLEAPPTRLLLVDDNPDALAALGMLLELDGHEVRTASSGADALEITREFVPEVALVDIGMPGIDGFQLAHMLRARAEFDSTLLVALTGYGSESDKSRALAAGFDFHLTKPLSLDKFRNVLSRRAGRTIGGLL
ncbi:hybrid sensor histidine kinase/response regulator [Pararobbsia alpina]|uniref:histidine kinase n=1 Tax=Pararobbsia alpina TaxID=621374 RepID=A0A6S7CH14_9BURK|nr:ATP-binding protein [Pararobbsia alpina]CAB3789614.1 Sensor histidine kinase RcsC [Pararobbsia alpina]